jgi:hypothetical protein
MFVFVNAMMNVHCFRRRLPTKPTENNKEEYCSVVIFRNELLKMEGSSRARSFAAVDSYDS